MTTPVPVARHGKRHGRDDEDDGGGQGGRRRSRRRSCRQGSMVIGQTANILLYLGARHALAPKAEAGRLWVHGFAIDHRRLRSGDPRYPSSARTVAVLRGTSGRQRKKRTEEFWSERRAQNISATLRGLLKEGGGAYVTGRRVTYVDPLAVPDRGGAALCFSQNAMKAFERKIPGLIELRDRVAEAAETSRRTWRASGALPSTSRGFFRRYKAAG